MWYEWGLSTHDYLYLWRTFLGQTWSRDVTLLSVRRLVGRILSRHLVCFSSVCYCQVPYSNIVGVSNVRVRELLYDHAQHDYREWAWRTGKRWQAVYHECPISELDQVLAEFAAFLTMHQEIYNRDKHNHLREDLKENTQWFVFFYLHCCMNNYTLVLFMYLKL
jgi:hypothetical protein